MGIAHFSEIRAWQAAREMVKMVYAVSQQGKLAKDFSLRDQLRRAAVSGMSNIAEGFSRRSPQDFARFLDMARASVSEVQSLLFVCEDVGYLTEEQTKPLMEIANQTISFTARFQEYLRSDRVHEDEAVYQP